MIHETKYDMQKYNKIVKKYIDCKDKFYLAQQLFFLLDFRNENLLLQSKILLENKLIRDIYQKDDTNEACDLRILIFNYLNNEERDKLLKMFKIKRQKLIPHILTDIDDTLFPNPTNIKYLNITGRDTSWIKQKPYPGIKSFYKHFYSNIDLSFAKYSTILTATPNFLQKRRFGNENLNDILGKNFGFLSGKESKLLSIWDSILGTYKGYGLLTPDPDSLAETKFIKFKQYSLLFPEYKIIFIGDNGQGDLIAGLKMIKSDKNCIVFIHNLYSEGRYLFDKKKMNSYSNERLFFFDNYLNLALLFLKFKFIKKIDFLKIKKAFISDVNNIEKLPNYNLYAKYLIKKTKKKNLNSSKKSKHNHN